MSSPPLFKYEEHGNITLTLTSTTPSSVKENVTRGSPTHLKRTRVIHMQKRFDTYTHSIRLRYDPMIGIQTGAILSTCLFLVMVYIIYKAKCRRHTWYEDDDLYIKVYNRKLAQLGGKPMLIKKKPNQPNVNKEVPYKGHMESLEQTAKWIQSQPLNSTISESVENVVNANRLCPTCSMRDIRTIPCTQIPLPRVMCKKCNTDKNICQCELKKLNKLKLEKHNKHKSKKKKNNLQKKEKKLQKLAAEFSEAKELLETQSLPDALEEAEKISNIKKGSMGTNNTWTNSKGIHIQMPMTPQPERCSPFVTTASKRPTNLFPDGFKLKRPPLHRQQNQTGEFYLEPAKLADTDLCSSKYNSIDIEINDCYSAVNLQKQKDKNSFITEASIEMAVLRSAEADDINISGTTVGACGTDSSYRSLSDVGSVSVDIFDPDLDLGISRENELAIHVTKL